MSVRFDIVKRKSWEVTKMRKKKTKKVGLEILIPGNKQEHKSITEMNWLERRIELRKERRSRFPAEVKIGILSGRW